MAKYFDDQNSGSIAKWLRALRIRTGYSQKNVADILNVNRSTYTYYETGKTTPDPKTLDRIARIFGVDINIFLLEEEPVSLLRDSDGDRSCEPKRSPKKVKPDPQKIGHLTSAEKEVIAYLRDKGLSAADLLIVLRERFDKEEQGYL